MSPSNKAGLRVAGAGTAAAALTLAAAAPAFAQTDYEYVDASFNLVDTNEAVGTLEYEGQEAYIAVEGPDPLQGDLVEVTIDLSDSAGIVAVTAAYDDRCEVSGDILTCIDDGTADLAGTFFSLELGLGAAGAPGDIAYYFAKVKVNGEEELDWEGAITVSEDFESGEDDGEDPVELPGDFPVGDIEEADDAYGFAFLNHLLEGAEAGATLTAAPHFRVDETSGLGDERAATALFFSNSVSLDAWFDEQTGRYTGTVEVTADYDNCVSYAEGVTCVVEEFTPQVGTTYAPSEATPIQYEVLGDVVDAEGAYYTAWDINEATLDLYRQILAVGPGAENQFELVETDYEIGDEYFSEHYGLIWFTEQEDGQGDIEPVDPDATGDASGQLPTTGNSSIILISSAAAALLAGAVVFVMRRRRKTAGTWE
jgi:LPXTG-motif cell wall-anchored protein